MTPSLPRPARTRNFAAMEEDLTPYLSPDTSWIAPYAERMGWDALAAYYDRVMLRLLRMEPGEELRVDGEVRPANRPLFLRCACLAIGELRRIDPWSTYDIEDRGKLILKR